MLEVNKFMMEGEQIDFQDAEAREEINTQVVRLDGRIDDVDERVTSEATRLDGRIDTVNGRVTSEATRLDGRIDTKPDIDDNSVSTSKVWSSNKVANEDADLQSQINNKASIDDSDITTSKTWSSSKILAEDNSIRENIATVNLTNRADQNYDVGDLIEWNYKLCKVIAPISQGDLLELGTNLNTTTVSDELHQVSGSEIDDLVISTQKTWSSSKINNELNGEESATVNLSFGGVTSQTTVKKKGKTCYIAINLENYTATTFDEVSIGTVPEAFRPSDVLSFAVLARGGGSWSTSTYTPLILRIAPNGSIMMRGNNNDLSNTHYLGWQLQWEV